MSGSFIRGGEENVPGILGACAPAILSIWQEAHALISVIDLLADDPAVSTITCMLGKLRP